MRAKTRHTSLMLAAALVALAVVVEPASAQKTEKCRVAIRTIRAALKDLDTSYGYAYIVYRRDIRNTKSVAALRKAWEADPYNKAAYARYIDATGELAESKLSLKRNAEQRKKDHLAANDAIFDAQKLECPPAEDTDITDLQERLFSMVARFTKQQSSLLRQYRKIK